MNSRRVREPERLPGRIGAHSMSSHPTRGGELSKTFSVDIFFPFPWLSPSFILRVSVLLSSSVSIHPPPLPPPYPRPPYPPVLPCPPKSHTSYLTHIHVYLCAMDRTSSPGPPPIRFGVRAAGELALSRTLKDRRVALDPASAEPQAYIVEGVYLRSSVHAGRSRSAPPSPTAAWDIGHINRNLSPPGWK